MNFRTIITLSLFAAAFAANAQTSATSMQSPLQTEVEACKANAGSQNHDEKMACIQVALEKAVWACETSAASPAMKVERDACIQVANETAKQ